ncbi:MAG: hypothetical protein PHR15_01290 [Atopobiaceae bacterium]|jgi:hypothetical protein|nr:hypothetical protein [Atopobiaceae bacterium]MCH4181274.1 hypothetical protein [Atopobiaceae bacterium]MCH4214804.1 hypothetical protein [Atopobiaceae bacterium]MCH4276808.1 hypothetical protein [Atopobiaceae bacterium]MCI1226153.1 hypothetical protein [Atopobiaceae bacterium]
MMKSKMTDAQDRKVLQACRNGWFMSGTYRVLFDNHERTFDADSTGILFSSVNKWFKSHKARHANADVVVKCIKAC